jgi:hypothetical protein
VPEFFEINVVKTEVQEADRYTRPKQFLPIEYLHLPCLAILSMCSKTY